MSKKSQHFSQCSHACPASHSRCLVTCVRINCLWKVHLVCGIVRDTSLKFHNTETHSSEYTAIIIIWLGGEARRGAVSCNSWSQTPPWKEGSFYFHTSRAKCSNSKASQWLQISYRWSQALLPAWSPRTIQLDSLWSWKWKSLALSALFPAPFRPFY